MLPLLQQKRKALTPEEMTRVLKPLIEQQQIQCVVLFGSVAEREGRQPGDYDLGVQSATVRPI